MLNGKTNPVWESKQKPLWSQYSAEHKFVISKHCGSIVCFKLLLLLEDKGVYQTHLRKIKESFFPSILTCLRLREHDKLCQTS